MIGNYRSGRAAVVQIEQFTALAVPIIQPFSPRIINPVALQQKNEPTP